MTTKNTKCRLVKDLVIPAGTVFSQAPSVTRRDESFAQAVIGLTNNTFGLIEYEVWGDDQDKLKEWFEEVK